MAAQIKTNAVYIDGQLVELSNDEYRKIKRKKAHGEVVEMEKCSNCGYKKSVGGTCFQCGHSFRIGC